MAMNLPWRDVITWLKLRIFILNIPDNFVWSGRPDEEKEEENQFANGPSQ